MPEPRRAGGGRLARRPAAQGSLVKLARSRLARTGRDTGMAVRGGQGMLAGPPKEPRTDRDVPVKALTIGTQRPGS